MTTTSTTVRVGTYEIDAARSTIEFTLTSWRVLKTKGTFAIRNGTVVVGQQAEDSTVTAVIDLTSFHTNNTRRDKDVTSRRFLDAANVPDLTFTGRAIDDGTMIRGTLTRTGHLLPITLTLVDSDPVGSGYAFTAKARIDRYALGVTTGKGIVPRYVDAELRILVQ